MKDGDHHVEPEFHQKCGRNGFGFRGHHGWLCDQATGQIPNSSLSFAAAIIRISAAYGRAADRDDAVPAALVWRRAGAERRCYGHENQ
jgi:hypothetical protein